MRCMRYLYEVGESRVFALLVLDELQRLTLLTAQMGHLLLKLISSLSLELTHTQIQHVYMLHAHMLHKQKEKC